MLAVIDSVLTGEYRRLDTKLSSSGIIMLVVGIVIIVRGNEADGLIGVAWGDGYAVGGCTDWACTPAPG